MVAAFEICCSEFRPLPPHRLPLPTSHSDDKFSKCLKNYFKQINICFPTHFHFTRYQCGQECHLVMAVGWMVKAPWNAKALLIVAITSEACVKSGDTATIPARCMCPLIACGCCRGWGCTETSAQPCSKRIAVLLRCTTWRTMGTCRTCFAPPLYRRAVSLRTLLPFSSCTGSKLSCWSFWRTMDFGHGNLCRG